MPEFRILEDTDRRLLVVDTRHPAKILFALPFLLYSGWLLGHLLIGYAYYAFTEGLGWALTSLPGMLLGALFGLAFLAPAVVLLARRSTVIDTDLGILGHRYELFGLHTPGKLSPVADVTGVILRKSTKKSTSRIGKSDARRTTYVTWYVTELQRSNGESLVLFQETDRSGARDLAKRTAVLLEKPLEDRL